MSNLDLKFKCEDLDKTVTIREYLKTLLTTLWSEGEGFSGKRPFGNSGWEYDLYKPLIEAGCIEGSLDEDGHIKDVDSRAGHSLILILINEAFAQPKRSKGKAA